MQKGPRERPYGKIWEFRLVCAAMRILDKNWPWHAFAMLLFAAGLGFIHFMLEGINEDFGTGFAVGLMVGITVALVAAGWRKGEMAQLADEPELPLLPEPFEQPLSAEYFRRSGSTRQDD